MDRLGADVTRELGRFGAVGDMASLVEVWSDAVGEEIARNAWPARVSRDGTLHIHARDSVWAFELTARADEIRARLGEQAPPRVVFAPGPLPEPTAEASEATPKRAPKPSAEHIAKAASLVRVIRDEDLRKVAAKTVAASLAKADYDRSFW
jgi:hypothetical protein